MLEEQSSMLILLLFQNQLLQHLDEHQDLFHQFCLGLNSMLSDKTLEFYLVIEHKQMVEQLTDGTDRE